MSIFNCCLKNDAIEPSYIPSSPRDAFTEENGFQESPSAKLSSIALSPERVKVRPYYTRVTSDLFEEVSSSKFTRASLEKHLTEALNKRIIRVVRFAGDGEGDLFQVDTTHPRTKDVNNTYVLKMFRYIQFIKDLRGKGDLATAKLPPHPNVIVPSHFVSASLVLPGMPSYKVTKREDIDEIPNYHILRGIIMDYVAGSDLKAITEASLWKNHHCLTIKELHSITHQILKAVDHLQRYEVIHRDIKPSNILIDTDPDSEAPVKLVDFGLAKKHSSNSTQDRAKTFLGTNGFMPPEVVAHKGQSIHGDSFSIGATVLYLFCKQKFTHTDPAYLKKHYDPTGKNLFTSLFFDHIWRHYRIKNNAEPKFFSWLESLVNFLDAEATKKYNTHYKDLSEEQQQPLFTNFVEAHENQYRPHAQFVVDFMDFLNKALIIDDKDRPTVQELSKHPFFTRAYYNEEDPETEESSSITSNDSYSSITSNDSLGKKEAI